MICGCDVQRKVQRAMAAKDMQDKAQRVESRCIALLHPLRFAQEEHGASRSDGRGCSRTTRLVEIAHETDADVRCNARPTMEEADGPRRVASMSLWTANIDNHSTFDAGIASCCSV